VLRGCRDGAAPVRDVGLYAWPADEEPDPLAELDRAARDARLGPIGGGTDEIMKEILGKGLGL